jgi:head-tail adaptor
MLPADELDQIRTDLETTLPDTCNIMTLTRTSDSQGGWTEAWGTASTAVACRVDFIGGQEAVQSGGLLPYTRAIVTLPHDTTITAQNRVEYGSNTYTVQAVNVGSWLGVKRASVEKI